MKKSFVAVAVLGAFAGSALAADVTLYGVIDLGLHYQNVNAAHKADVNKFDMAAGQNSGSRFGLKGSVTATRLVSISKTVLMRIPVCLARLLRTTKAM